MSMSLESVGFGMAYLAQAEIVFFVVIDVGQDVDRSRSSGGISSIHTATSLSANQHMVPQSNLLTI